MDWFLVQRYKLRSIPNAFSVTVAISPKAKGGESCVMQVHVLKCYLLFGWLTMILAIVLGLGILISCKKRCLPNWMQHPWCGYHDSPMSSWSAIAKTIWSSPLGSSAAFSSVN